MTEILRDVTFSHKIGLKGLDSMKTGHQLFGALSWEGALDPNYWTLAEWASQYGLRDGYETVQSQNGIIFRNPCKTVTVTPNEGKIHLEAFANREYSAPRRGEESWVHLLLEQTLNGADRKPFYNMNELIMHLDFVITQDVNHMTAEEFDANIHSSQISWYITVENSKCETVDAEGRPDYMWFGLPIYDYRFPVQTGPTYMLDRGTQRLIYGMDRNVYLPKTVEIGKNYTIRCNVLPHIKKAFDIAKENNYLKGAAFDDMVIGSMNLGWELPGTFSSGFLINKISITCE